MRALLLAAAYSVISHGVPHGDRAEIELPHGLTLLPTHDAAAAGARFRPGPASRYGVRAVGGGGRRNRKWHFIASHYSERVICFRFVFVLYSSGIVSLIVYRRRVPGHGVPPGRRAGNAERTESNDQVVGIACAIQRINALPYPPFGSKRRTLNGRRVSIACIEYEF